MPGCFGRCVPKCWTMTMRDSRIYINSDFLQMYMKNHSNNIFQHLAPSMNTLNLDKKLNFLDFSNYGRFYLIFYCFTNFHFVINQSLYTLSRIIYQRKRDQTKQVWWFKSETVLLHLFYKSDFFISSGFLLIVMFCFYLVLIHLKD